MKKYKLEIILALIFVLFFVILFLQSFYGFTAYLPAIYSFIGLIIIALIGVIIKKNKSNKLQEAYAPKYFGQSLITSILAIAVILFATVILNKNHFSKNLDFTTNKVNSLSDESIKFLESLTKQIQIICIPAPNQSENYCDNSKNLIQLYAHQSKNIINLGQLDLSNKNLLNQVQPSGFSRIVLITDNNKTELENQISESQLTNALINLIKFKKTVYFLSGFGEPTVNSSENSRNYADIANSLQAKAYVVKDWNIKNGDLPDDAQVLIAGDNDIKYPVNVEDMLIKFVKRGGKVLLIVNPYREQGLSKFYSMLNLKLEDNLLTLNKNTPLGKQLSKQNLIRPPIIVSNFNPASSITKVITQVYGAQAVMPVDGGRPFEILTPDSKTPSKIHITKLMSAYSAAPITMTEATRNKIDINKPFNLLPDTKFDAQKMWPLGVDVNVDNDDPKNKSEVVVFGFSIVNPYSKSIPITEELIPLTIANLYQDKELVSIPPRDIGPKPFNLSRNPGGWLPLFAILLPFLTALIGFFIWMKRRSR